MTKIRSFHEFTRDGYDGFEIVCDDQTVTLAIANFQSCCENWGYFMSEDRLDKFVGSELRDIEIVDTALNARLLPEYGLDAGEAMFVNLKTDRGTLQFVAYNAHNGYYGHDAYVSSAALNFNTAL